MKKKEKVLSGAKPDLKKISVFFKMTAVILTVFTHIVYGQDSNIGQFAIWKAKEGQLKNFEEGYKQHLEWHKTNGDPWSWYGWFFISGPRYGQFADATFNHTWADFDKAVKPTEDMADNRLHVFPFADVQSIFKIAEVSGASIANTPAMKTRLIKLVTLNVRNVEQALKVSEKLRDYYLSKQVKLYKTYRVVDGGETNQIILILGFDSWKDYSVSEDINRKITEYDYSLKTETIYSIVSETMAYRADMSLFPQ